MVQYRQLETVKVAYLLSQNMILRKSILFSRHVFGDQNSNSQSIEDIIYSGVYIFPGDTDRVHTLRHV